MYRDFISKGYIIHFKNHEIEFPELFERARFVTEMANNGVHYLYRFPNLIQNSLPPNRKLNFYKIYKKQI